MNLAIRGIDAPIAHGDTFHNHQPPDLKADYVLANPPFNDSDWRGEAVEGRQTLGVRHAAQGGREVRLRHVELTMPFGRVVCATVELDMSTYARHTCQMKGGGCLGHATSGGRSEELVRP